MPALDKFHQVVVRALEKEGWTVESPYTLSYEERRVQIDIGAERLIAANKGTQRIAVEIKTFGSVSPVTDLADAIGQFAIYEDVLSELEPERMLYIAIPKYAFDTFFAERFGQYFLRKRLHHALVYDPGTGEITQWLPEP